jgi:hypothetical protein
MTQHKKNSLSIKGLRNPRQETFVTLIAVTSESGEDVAKAYLVQ